MKRGYAILDHKAGFHQDPFCAPSDGMAARWFEQECRSPQGRFAMFPEDFELFYIGDWDEDRALLTPAPNGTRVSVATGVAMAAKGPMGPFASEE